MSFVITAMLYLLHMMREIFSFTKYHAITEIYLDGRMIIKENLLLQPETNYIHQMGQMEDFSHQANFIFLNEKAAIKRLIDQAADWLTLQPEVTFGITALARNGFVLRLLGHKAESLYDCLKGIVGMVNGE